MLVFFLGLGLGCLIGGVRVLGISLGSVGGVLLAGLAFANVILTLAGTLIMLA